MSKKIFSKKNLINLVFVVFVYLIVRILISVGFINPLHQITLYTIGINIILALGLNLIIGFTGQFSLGHAGFMAIGAYSTAIVTLRIPGYGGLFLGLLAGVIISGICSLLIALPTLRLKGDYLAIATLGFGEIIRIIILNMDLTGGASGLFNIPKYTNWSLIFMGIIISIVTIYNYIVSSPGRATLAVKDDEIAAEAMGVNTTKYKTVAFVIGGMLAAIAGGLYASYFHVLKPETFSFFKSVDILVIVVFGGMGSLTGTIISAIALGIINYFLADFATIRMILYSLTLIIVMIIRPNGLLGNKEIKISDLFLKLGGKIHGNKKARNNETK